MLEMCLHCVVLALSLVMAGSGDLSTLRLFRSLRKVLGLVAPPLLILACG